MRPLIRKEKRLAIAALAIFAITTAYNALIAPALARMETLNRVIPEKQQELIEVTQTAYQIKDIQSQIDHLQKTLTTQSDNFSPKAALAKCINNANLTDHQKNLTQTHHSINKPTTQTTLTLDLQTITLKQLVNLIDQAKQKNLILKNLTLKRNKTTLNATLTLSTLTPINKS